MTKTIILGSGIAGLSASYHMKKNGMENTIYEKDADWGGLCGNFTIDGFRFDRFVHFTFTDDEYIYNTFNNSSELYEHPSISNNFYNGYWLKHPAQNNLFPLPVKEKVKIIKDFVERPHKEISELKDYAQWLECQYGKYFAHNFPFKYTRKYWGVEPNELETKWIGNRMHSPSLEEVLEGAMAPSEEIFYYTKYMRYPKIGGFRSILNNTRKDLDIVFNKKAVLIDTDKKFVQFEDSTQEKYETLVSSIPLPEIINCLKGVPLEVKNAAKNLKHTCGYMVSLGFKRNDVARDLWFYIYDEDIPPARVYSPSKKSPDNVPEGCSSIQAEIFFGNDKEIMPKEEALEKTVNKLAKSYNFQKNEIVVCDIRFEKYANITFDKDIYKNRKIVLDYLEQKNINSIGRFGKWEYFWTHQAFADGIAIANKLVQK